MGNLSLKEILHIKDKGKITNSYLLVMKGIRNTKGAALCLPFLIGGYCDSTDPCGYHLQVSDPNHLPGTSNADHGPIHDWLMASKEYICLITSSSQKTKLAPSSSS